MAFLTRVQVRRGRGGRPGTRYRVRWRDPNGRNCSKTFDRSRDAEAFLHEIESSKSRGTYIDPSAGKITFAAWVERWWPTTLDLRASSRARSEFEVRSRLLPRFGPYPVAAIRHADVTAFLAELSASGLAPASVRKSYNVLRSILAAAERSGIIGRSPCFGVKLPPVRREEPRFLSAEELERLAEGIGPRYGPLILTGGYAGLRWGELAGLKVSRLRLLERRLDIVETVTEVRGNLIVGPPKTHERTVTLPRSLAGLLGEHIGRYPDAQGYVFSAPSGGPLRRTNFARRYFKPAVEAAGLSPLRLHDLRHTAAALAIADGAHPMEIKARLGHASVSTTLNVYGHLFPVLDDRLAEGLDAMRAKTLAQDSRKERPQAVVDLSERHPESGR